MVPDVSESGALMSQGYAVLLDQGCNFGDPRSELKRGELRIARNSHYIPGNSQLYKLNGRSLYGSVGTQVTGLGWCRFRSGSGYVFASAGNAYYSGPLGTFGAFTSRASGLSGVGKMVSVYDQKTNRAFFDDGVNATRVWDGAASSMRLAGLTRPASGTLTFLANGTTAYTAGVTFYYCHTEVDDTSDPDNAIESPPSTPVSLASSAASGTFKYAVSALANASTTKINVYRTQNGGAVFYRIAQFASSNVRYYDGDDTEALGNSIDNDTQWGFKTVDDGFLSTREIIPMVGTPILGNYISVNGTLPIGNISGLFQNSRYVAGVSSFPTHLYFSPPGQPEFMAPTSFIEVPGGNGEPISGAGTANDRLVLFTQNSIHRLNAFPLPIDPGFGLGSSSLEEVSKDHGALSKNSIINFGVGGSNNQIFYVSESGPMITDAYNTLPLNKDLDWSSRWLNKGMLSKCVARRYAKNHQIWLFLASKDSMTLDYALIYHYHPDHMKYGPIGKWTGPVHVRCGAATSLSEETAEGRLLVADSNSSGNVYCEDQGEGDAQFYDDPDGKIAWEWETGDNAMKEESANKRRHRVFLSLVGTDTFGGRLSFARNKADKKKMVPLKEITDASKTTELIGASEVEVSKTLTYRGGVWKTAAQDRWHLVELAKASRAVASLEVEVESFGRQK